ncbi:MAG: helix-turn-helix domain-containing protein, partial [Methanobacterium sp.]
MSERMERRKKERKNEIMDVAEKMIAQKGVQGMTMKEVAEKVDVATGTLYVYFKNKNSLCAAVNARIN